MSQFGEDLLKWDSEQRKTNPKKNPLTERDIRKFIAENKGTIEESLRDFNIIIEEKTNDN